LAPKFEFKNSKLHGCTAHPWYSARLLSATALLLCCLWLEELQPKPAESSQK